MKTSNSLCDLNLNIKTFDAGTNKNNQREVTLKSFENVVIIAITCLSKHITKNNFKFEKCCSRKPELFFKTSTNNEVQDYGILTYIVNKLLDEMKQQYVTK